MEDEMENDALEQDPAEYEPPEELDADLAQRNRVFELDNEDFALKATDGLTLYAKGCSIVLFYGKGSLSKKLLLLFHQLADEFSGTAFLTVNTALRRDIMRRFTDIKMSPNHILNRFTVRPIPFILVYRESNEPGISYPQAFYDGELSEEAYVNGDMEDSMYDWVANMACEPDYHGPVQSRSDDDVRRVGGDFSKPNKGVVDRVIMEREGELDKLQIDADDLDSNRWPEETILPAQRPYSDLDIGYVRF